MEAIFYILSNVLCNILEDLFPSFNGFLVIIFVILIPAVVLTEIYFKKRIQSSLYKSGDDPKLHDMEMRESKDNK